MKHKTGFEFGHSGPEGIRHEGIKENKDWASLGEKPFPGNIGDEMTEQADKINRLLDTIEIDESNLSNKNTARTLETAAKEETDNPVPTQTPETTTDDTQAQIEQLKLNIHSLFK